MESLENKINPTANRRYHFLISAFWALTGLILSWTYRPYIYENNLFDYHFADTIGSWVAVPSFVNLYLTIGKKKIRIEELVLKTVLAYILYEFIGLTGLHGVFDIYDVIATILSGVMTLAYIKLKK